MRLIAVLVGCVAVSALAGPKKKAPEPHHEKERPLYVSVQGTRTSSDEYKDLLGRADELLKEELANYKMELAPDGEDEKTGVEAMKAKQAEGQQVQLTLAPTESGMRATLLVTKYPGGGLKGSWFVNAGGPPPGELLEVVIPKCVEEAATDLGWKKK